MQMIGKSHNIPNTASHSEIDPEPVSPNASSNAKETGERYAEGEKSMSGYYDSV